MTFRTNRNFVIFTTVIAWIFLAPYLWKTGPNVVLETYLEAGRDFLSRVSPYQPPESGRDFYKYSPLFAGLLSLWTLLEERAAALLWAGLSALLFFSGLNRFFSWTWSSSGWIWFAGIASAMELNGSLRYQQANVLLVGVSLWALALLRPKEQISRAAPAALLAALVSQFKILGGVYFVPTLLASGLGAFRKYFAAALVGTLLLPLLYLGWNLNLEFHSDWLRVLSKDVSRAQLLDLRAYLGRAGWPSLGQASSLIVALVTMTINLKWAWLGRDPFSWSLLAWNASALLLVNTGTESPTFVLMTPAYFALAHRREPGAKVLLLAVFFLVSFWFSDLWPRPLRLHGTLFYFPKVAGNLLLWCGLLIYLLKDLRNGSLQEQIAEEV